MRAVILLFSDAIPYHGVLRFYRVTRLSNIIRLSFGKGALGAEIFCLPLPVGCLSESKVSTASVGVVAAFPTFLGFGKSTGLELERSGVELGDRGALFFWSLYLFPPEFLPTDLEFLGLLLPALPGLPEVSAVKFLRFGFFEVMRFVAN